jgi:site-specific DNA-cytosine methylase
MDKIDYSGYVNRVDLFMKGSPTEKRARRPERRALMMKFTEILVQPKMFMIENVKGLLSHDDGTRLSG